MTFSVSARMAEGTSSAARQERVDFLLEKMGLAEIRTAFVGDRFRKGISGGRWVGDAINPCVYVKCVFACV